MGCRQAKGKNAMAKGFTGQAWRASQTRDTTDEHPTWCLVHLHLFKEPLAAQCEHASAKGRYVVRLRTVRGNEWHCFEPSTGMQALSWVNGRAERKRLIHWQCFDCGEVMPLANYD